jgi:hypothetical protein
MPTVALVLFVTFVPLPFGWRCPQRSDSVGAVGNSDAGPDQLASAESAGSWLVATIELQVRVVEEPYLLTVHCDAYRDYLATVGRFVPGLGLDRSPR